MENAWVFHGNSGEKDIGMSLKNVMSFSGDCVDFVWCVLVEAAIQITDSMDSPRRALGQTARLDPVCDALSWKS